MRRIEYFPVFFRRGKLTARRAVVTALTTSPAPATAPAPASAVTFLTLRLLGVVGLF